MNIDETDRQALASANFASTVLGIVLGFFQSKLKILCSVGPLTVGIDVVIYTSRYLYSETTAT